jgi:hypothetical protein
MPTEKNPREEEARREAQRQELEKRFGLDQPQPGATVRTAAQREARQMPRQRIPAGLPRPKLTATPMLGWHLHWMNDDGQRLIEAQQGGYEFVSEEETKLDQVAPTPANSDLGTRVRKVVGKQENGEPMYAYLMKIPQNFYDEDQLALQAQVDRIDATIRTGKLVNVEKAYAPDKPLGADPGASIKIT